MAGLSKNIIMACVVVPANMGVMSGIEGLKITRMDKMEENGLLKLHELEGLERLAQQGGSLPDEDLERLAQFTINFQTADEKRQTAFSMILPELSERDFRRMKDFETKLTYDYDMREKTRTNGYNSGEEMFFEDQKPKGQQLTLRGLRYGRNQQTPLKEDYVNVRPAKNNFSGNFGGLVDLIEEQKELFLEDLKDYIDGHQFRADRKSSCHPRNRGINSELKETITCALEICSRKRDCGWEGPGGDNEWKWEEAFNAAASAGYGAENYEEVSKHVAVMDHLRAFFMNFLENYVTYDVLTKRLDWTLDTKSGLKESKELFLEELNDYLKRSHHISRFPDDPDRDVDINSDLKATITSALEICLQRDDCPWGYRYGIDDKKWTKVFFAAVCAGDKAQKSQNYDEVAKHVAVMNRLRTFFMTFLENHYDLEELTNDLDRTLGWVSDQNEKI